MQRKQLAYLKQPGMYGMYKQTFLSDKMTFSVEYLYRLCNLVGEMIPLATGAYI